MGSEAPLNTFEHHISDYKCVYIYINIVVRFHLYIIVRVIVLAHVLAKTSELDQT